MSQPIEFLRFEYDFDGSVEDVEIKLQEKTFERFEAWVEVRAISKYCGVFKNSQRPQIVALLRSDIEHVYREALRYVADYLD